MSTRTTIHTDAAPAAIGPYSQGVAFGEQLYCSGALPLDPESGDLVMKSLGDEMSRCLQNLAAICESAGTSLARAVRITVYTTCLDRFAEINEAYAGAFTGDPPARVTIGVAALPRGARVEIDAIAPLG